MSVSFVKIYWSYNCIVLGYLTQPFLIVILVDTFDSRIHNLTRKQRNDDEKSGNFELPAPEW